VLHNLDGRRHAGTFVNGSPRWRRNTWWWCSARPPAYRRRDGEMAKPWAPDRGDNAATAVGTATRCVRTVGAARRFRGALSSRPANPLLDGHAGRHGASQFARAAVTVLTTEDERMPTGTAARSVTQATRCIAIVERRTRQPYQRESAKSTPACTPRTALCESALSRLSADNANRSVPHRRHRNRSDRTGRWCRQGTSTTARGGARDNNRVRRSELAAELPRIVSAHQGRCHRRRPGDHMDPTIGVNHRPRHSHSARDAALAAPDRRALHHRPGHHAD